MVELKVNMVMDVCGGGTVAPAVLPVVVVVGVAGVVELGGDPTPPPIK